MRPLNPTRKRERYLANFDGGIGHDTWIRKRPCFLCAMKAERQATPTRAAHAKSRGAGGDWRALVPLCDRHHREQEGNPLRYKEMLLDASAALVAKHQAERLDPPPGVEIPF